MVLVFKYTLLNTKSKPILYGNDWCTSKASKASFSLSLTPFALMDQYRAEEQNKTVCYVLICCFCLFKETKLQRIVIS